ncbi:zinc finger protein 2 homolog [Gigantopelta aegis]|uniref:zinc finger protein 2 homolog n=1 Tax=Gigantopelta aegis TaxID=1735272 RepID=UPI001B88D204|nr:zinc finger protein 2 homolog [Gigantopelta aegis]
MNKSDVRKASSDDKQCVVCGNHFIEVRRIESKRIKGTSLSTLLYKYGGIGVQTGFICRACFVKVDRLHQQCCQFYDECQRNAVTTLSKTINKLENYLPVLVTPKKRRTCSSLGSSASDVSIVCHDVIDHDHDATHSSDVSNGDTDVIKDSPAPFDVNDQCMTSDNATDGGTATVDDGGTASVDDGDTASVDDGGTASVDDGGTDLVDVTDGGTSSVDDAGTALVDVSNGDGATVHDNEGDGNAGSIDVSYGRRALVDGDNTDATCQSLLGDDLHDSVMNGSGIKNKSSFLFNQKENCVSLFKDTTNNEVEQSPSLVNTSANIEMDQRPSTINSTTLIKTEQPASVAKVTTTNKMKKSPAVVKDTISSETDHNTSLVKNNNNMKQIKSVNTLFQDTTNIRTNQTKDLTDIRHEQSFACTSEANSNGPYECRLCSMTFVNLTDREDHLWNHSAKYYCPCCICDKLLAKKRGLNVDVAVCTNPSQYTCELCHNDCIVESDLKKHFTIYSTKHVCSTCGKRYANCQYLKKHMDTHFGPKRFACEHCGKAFHVAASLRQHSKVHTGERPYVCTKCGMAFTQCGHFTTHMQIHSGKKAHKCNECERSFYRPGQLKSHKKVHDGSEPHVCKVCAKRFLGPSSLKRHMRVHTGEEPFKCEDCGKGFKGRFDLVRHARIHSGQKPFECDVCRLEFRLLAGLKKHKKKHAT